jgi:hypothetical protein
MAAQATSERPPFAPVLPDPPAPAAQGSGQGRLHLGRRRQSLARRLVRRDGLQYRSFQSARDRGDAPADGAWRRSAIACISRPRRPERLADKTAAALPRGPQPRVLRLGRLRGGGERDQARPAIRAGDAARRSAGRLISRFPSYHGATLGALAVTGYAPMTAPFDPMMRPMPKIPAPRAYLDGLDPERPRHRPPLRRHAGGAHPSRKAPQTVLAFLVEPIGGASTGALVPPAGLHGPRIREICDRHGVLLIHDEVMTGGGRTGKFFGAEHYGVASRHSLTGLQGLRRRLRAARRDDRAMSASSRPVLDAGGFIHGFTYAGNPLACAAGPGRDRGDRARGANGERRPDRRDR